MRRKKNTSSYHKSSIGLLITTLILLQILSFLKGFWEHASEYVINNFRLTMRLDMVERNYQLTPKFMPYIPILVGVFYVR